MTKPLNMIERQKECAEALRRAVRMVAVRANADDHPNDWADAIMERLKGYGFTVHHMRVNRNGRAPNGPPMTAAQVRKARALRRANPRMRISTIAKLVDANSGRVSEALAGMR